MGTFRPKALLLSARLAFGIALVVELGLPRAAHAYRTAADLPEFADSSIVRWNELPIELELVNAPDGLAVTDVLAAVVDAAAAWETPACSNLSFGVTTATSQVARPGDGHNTIEWITDWSDRGYDPTLPGLSDIQYDQYRNTEGRIVEADVYLNASDFEWRLRADGGSSQVDVLAVLTHELGHVIGLLHPCEDEPEVGSTAPLCGLDADWNSVTMYPHFSSDQATLEPDDITGLCVLYAENGLSECADADCEDAGEVTCDAPEECAALQVPGNLRDGGTCDAGACTDARREDAGLGKALGANCSSPTQCNTRICLVGENLKPVCTQSCGLNLPACPSQWSCFSIDEENVCVPPDSGSGCSSVPMQRLTGMGTPLVFLATLLIGLRRLSRRRESKGPDDDHS